MVKLSCKWVMLLAGLAACSDAVAPERSLNVRIETEHYVFHLAGGDQVDTLWQEQYHAWLLQTLAVTPAHKIDYYKYLDRAQKKRVMGVDGNGIAYPEKWELHTIWRTDNHESVHVVVVTMIGRAVALFGEGIAVAHQVDPARNDLVPKWSGRTLNDIARELWANGSVPPLSDLLTSAGFRTYPEGTTYPLAGSFVRYLLDSRGLARMKQFFAAADYADGASATTTKFRAAYGEELADVWQQWRASL